MAKQARLNLAVLLVAVIFAGCAHQPVATTPLDGAHVLAQLCSRDRSASGVKGSVWMRVKSQEASGQFPALISIKKDSNLVIDVTNLIGGRVAHATVSKKEFEVQSSDGSFKDFKGADSWGGIPVIFARDLFLGVLPCPNLQEAKVVSYEDGVLKVESTFGDGFTYYLGSYERQPITTKLEWAQKGRGHIIEFTFKDPDSKTKAPGRFEAKSKIGEISVRWKDRSFSFE